MKLPHPSTLPRVAWNGLSIAIENPKGSVRSGKKPNGAIWRTKMTYPYGFIDDSEGVDGDEVDCFLGDNADAKEVYIVHQNKVDDWKNYDEDKVMLGFNSLSAAKAAFLANYDDPRFLGPITTMPLAEFVYKVRATKQKPAMIKSMILFFRYPKVVTA